MYSDTQAQRRPWPSPPWAWRAPLTQRRKTMKKLVAWFRAVIEPKFSPAAYDMGED